MAIDGAGINKMITAFAYRKNKKTDATFFRCKDNKKIHA